MKTPNLIVLRMARSLTFLFMLFCVLIYSAGVFSYSNYAGGHPGDFLIYKWTPGQMEAVFSRIGLSFQWWIQWNLVSSVVFAVIVCAIGFFLFFRKIDDWFSLYVSAAFVLFGTFSGYPVNAFAGNYPVWEPIIVTLGVLAWPGLLLIFYGFPDGKFVPGWARWGAIILVMGFGIDIVVFGGDTPPPPLAMVMLVALLIAPFSQIYRYRKVSNPVERQQTKWVMIALLLIMLIGIIPGFSGLFVPDLTNPNSIYGPFLALTSASTNLIMALFPLSILLAMLRYRLWDVDVIIRRTLVYGVVSAGLALVFFGGVTVLQRVFQSLSGQQSAISVVISTLAIAALFNPLRRLTQDFIDRRFYRKKYNAELALKKFTELARSETDIEQLSAEIMAVVQETMQPEKAGLWLREAKK